MSSLSRTALLRASAPAARCSCGAVVRPSSAAPSSSPARAASTAAAARPASVPAAAASLPSQRKQQSAKSRAKAKQARDEKLRKCIELYHLTSTFLPTRPTNGIPGLAQAQDPQASSSALDEELELRIRNELAVGTSLANQTGTSLPSFRTGTDLTQQASNLERPSSFFDDGEENTNGNSSDTSLSAGQFASGRRAGTNAARALGIQNLSGVTPTDLQDPTAQARLRRANFRVKPDGARAVLGKGRLLAMDGTTSQRDALVRDALFGTVGVELPGLEIVRERIQAKRRREQQQRQQAQAKAGEQAAKQASA